MQKTSRQTYTAVITLSNLFLNNSRQHSHALFEHLKSIVQCPKQQKMKFERLKLNDVNSIVGNSLHSLPEYKLMTGHYKHSILNRNKYPLCLHV